MQWVSDRKSNGLYVLYVPNEEPLAHRLQKFDWSRYGQVMGVEHGKVVKVFSSLDEAMDGRQQVLRRWCRWSAR